MQHTKKFSVATLSIACGIGLFAAGIGSANAACTNASLVGTFYYTSVEVEIRPTGTDYCEQTGTATADGAGHFTSVVQTRRCSLSPGGTSTGTNQEYKVKPDCSFTSEEIPPSPGSTSHGMILMNGDMVLVDGTLKSPTNSVKINHVVAVRTSKKKPPVMKKK